MTRRHVCIHGHFYQPPRENPWSGEVERQPSAAPHHDWNARITEECYRPNAAARITDAASGTERRVNNYERISFNFGPTLLDWLAREAPDVHASLVAADRSGHTALAQVYNHMILPLASPRDRRCQVAWGVRDFEHRFGRRPAGMWLPETAVDLPSLETLAEAGIRFTVLAPHQARRVRERDAGRWVEVDEHTLDTTVAYEQRLPSGRSIALFFYDGPVARGVAFEGLLDDGRNLADRLVAVLPTDDAEPRLAHIATDGESYGHHHRFGEMALAAALERLASREDVSLTHYAEFLERYPVRHEVRIADVSSWSCPHGVARWREDCGCGAVPRGSLAWRAPLREALDWLRDTLAPVWVAAAGRLVGDPWRAREQSIELLAPDGPWSDALLRGHAPRAARRLRALLDLQRHAMLMYTSCGWFFEDLARIETIQVLRYAGRAVELARECLDLDLGPELVRRLERATSARPGRGNGRELYERHVVRREPADVDAIPPADEPG